MAAGDTYTIASEKTVSGTSIELRFEAREGGGFKLVAEISPALREQDEISISSAIDHWQANNLAKWLQTAHTKTEA